MLLERFRKRERTRPAKPAPRDGATATEATHPVQRYRRPAESRAAADQRQAAARERQREAFGGTNWGAAFFGWLVAVGVGVILTALLSAAGATIALTELSPGEARESAETIGIAGGALLIAAALVAYFTGGYVAGRMSRFDGPRQGVAVWFWALLVATALAILGAIAGSEWNVFEPLELPRIPVDEGALTTGGAVALVAIVLGSLVAAMAGGASGERYHRRIDRVGEEAARPDGRG